MYYYDIVIRRPGQSPEHYWTGYSTPDYASCALPSVGRIVRESAGFGSPVTFENPERPLYVAADPFYNEVRLVRDGEPYATIAIDATPHKRPDRNTWIGGADLEESHVVDRYPGDDDVLAMCGATFKVAGIWDVRRPDIGPVTWCMTCLVLQPV